MAILNDRNRFSTLLDAVIKYSYLTRAFGTSGHRRNHMVKLHTEAFRGIPAKKAWYALP